jgi:farnesyl diphosphate synthase
MLQQDDYLDCYGDPVVIGKIGRDIEEKKCGWLVCQALLRATPEQKQIIQVRAVPVCHTRRGGLLTRPARVPF